VPLRQYLAKHLVDSNATICLPPLEFHSVVQDQARNNV
jgi:hypothetical protein